MIGRTNITLSSGSSSSEGVTTVDLPTCLKSLSSISGNSKITLTLEYYDISFVSGVEVRYKTDDFPTSPMDGEGLTVEGTPTSITINGLTDGTLYYFRVYLFNTVRRTNYYQTDDTNAKISAYPTAVEVSGIEPVIVGKNFLVLDQSGTFSLNAPEVDSLKVYLVGGGFNGSAGGSSTDSDDCTYYYGGSGGNGGYVYSFTVSDILSTYEFTGAVGQVGGNTTLVCTDISLNQTSKSGTRQTGGGGAEESSADYNASEARSGTNGILTPYGYVGSSGGGGGICTSGTYSGASGGIGAGDGGSSGDGYPATNYGCGGGGAKCASSSDEKNNKGGAGMQGCIIIEWA